MSHYRIGFIGAGNMATAIARGLVSAAEYAAGDCLASDISDERRGRFNKATHIDTTDDNARVVSDCRTVVLAIKPQQCEEVLVPLREASQCPERFVSILAGVRTERIEKALGGNIRVVRAMPNLPLQIGCGMTGLCRGRFADESDLEASAALFRPSGEVVVVDEERMDMVAALSGSGPAYFAAMAQAMIEAGLEDGLGLTDARRLVGQTMLGTARTILETSDNLNDLVRRVMSPGGSTEAAFKVLGEREAMKAMKEAVAAARERNEELGRG